MIHATGLRQQRRAGVGRGRTGRWGTGRGIDAGELTVADGLERVVVTRT